MKSIRLIPGVNISHHRYLIHFFKENIYEEVVYDCYTDIDLRMVNV